MPSRRNKIQMSTEEIREYLASHSRIILTTNGPGGFPHSVPMNYGVDEHGRILITSFRKSQKVKNLERDKRCTLLVESGETYHELKSVIIYAEVTIIGDTDEVARQMRRLQASSGLRESLGTGMSEQVRASLAKRVVLRCTPLRYVSWDHSRLDGFY